MVAHIFPSSIAEAKAVRLRVSGQGLERWLLERKCI